MAEESIAHEETNEETVKPLATTSHFPAQFSFEGILSIFLPETNLPLR